MILSQETRVEGIANTAPLTSSGRVQISPYGQFPHQRGLQHIDASDGKNLATQFERAKAMAPQHFAGLPWFRGHPDTNPERYTDTEAYGWVHGVQGASDGLYANVEWTPKGEQIIREKSFKFFSPVWDATLSTVAGKRVLRPSRLISVGFTNTPNIPVKPISNEAEQPIETADLLKELRALVEALMISNSISYDRAWQMAKTTRKDIFSRMQNPSQEPSFYPFSTKA